jgi:hypothetical protein
MKQLKKSVISQQLTKFTKEAFFEYVLPKIEKRYPAAIGKFFVILTSSVAYGIADKYSDLDIFVIFPEHSDYLRYHKKLQKLVELIDYPASYYDICDKGIRFEFESFFKSDIQNIVKKQSDENWLNQTEWLLCWFTNSVIIYDPIKVFANIKRKLLFFPKKIVKIKTNNNVISLLKYSEVLFSIRDSYVFDVYYFKSLKKVMDLIFWSNELYVPHPKWSFYLSRYVGSLGRQFHEDASAMLNSDEKNKALFVEKWVNIVINKCGNKLCIDKRFKKYTATKYEYDIKKEYLIKDDIYFKNYLDPIKKIELLFSYLDKSAPNKKYYLVEETGLNYNGRMNYDRLLRIQDKYLAHYKNKYLAINDDLYKKVVLYLVFVIWRKIRVAAKAPLRKNFFNQCWYNLQVFEHFVELLARLEKRAFVHEDSQIDFLKSDIKFKKVAGLLLKSLELSQDKKVEIYWECYNDLKKYILKNRILTEFEVESPLIIQFDIEYWKYENIRL